MLLSAPTALDEADKWRSHTVLTNYYVILMQDLLLADVIQHPEVGRSFITVCIGFPPFPTPPSSPISSLQ